MSNRVIYEPGDRAKEFSFLGCNPYAGCTHACKYCYVPAQLRMSREDFHAKVEPKKDFLKRLGKDAKFYAGTDRRVLLSFACDPYPTIEARLGLTRDTLKILRKNNIPFQVLSKAGTLPTRDFDLYRPGIDAYAVTLTTLDPGVAATLEPGAARPGERIDGLMEAKKQGIETWCSLEPVIEPIETLKIITMTQEWVDLYKIGSLSGGGDLDLSPHDWRAFVRRVGHLCRAYKKKYYIKRSLAKFMDDSLKNTDNRKIKKEQTI